MSRRVREVAGLEPVEKEMVATALLAMYAECPVDERPAMDPLFSSISVKLDLSAAFNAIAERATPTHREPGAGNVG